jgi:hypothetical protein
MLVYANFQRRRDMNFSLKREGLVVSLAQVKELLYAGPLPQAPLNHFCMLTDYVDPMERGVAYPNQDVVYGAGSIALDLSQFRKKRKQQKMWMSV